MKEHSIFGDDIILIKFELYRAHPKLVLLQCIGLMIAMQSRRTEFDPAREINLGVFACIPQLSVAPVRHLLNSPRVMPSVNACLKMHPFTPEPESIYCSSVCVISKDSKLFIPRSDRVHIMTSAFQLFLGDSEHLLQRCGKGG